jgi:hypothetical protein
MKERQGGSRAVLVAIVAAAIPLLVVGYVLSVAPAYDLVARGQLSVREFEAIYAPIDWATKRSTWAAWATDRYVFWWTGKHDPQWSASATGIPAL